MNVDGEENGEENGEINSNLLCNSIGVGSLLRGYLSNGKMQLPKRGVYKTE